MGQLVFQQTLIRPHNLVSAFENDPPRSLNKCQGQIGRNGGGRYVYGL